MNAGDLLFTLDDSLLVRELAQRKAAHDTAEARSKNASKTFERINALHQSKVVSQDEWGQTRSDLEPAQAAGVSWGVSV